MKYFSLLSYNQFYCFDQNYRLQLLNSLSFWKFLSPVIFLWVYFDVTSFTFNFRETSSVNFRKSWLQLLIKRKSLQYCSGNVTLLMTGWYTQEVLRTPLPDCSATRLDTLKESSLQARKKKNSNKSNSFVPTFPHCPIIIIWNRTISRKIIVSWIQPFCFMSYI